MVEGRFKPPLDCSTLLIMPAKQPKDSDQTFESAINRLELIVEEMESDKLPLEQLIERYEEGTRLAKICQEKLEAAEKRIEVIARGPAGKRQLVEFEGGGENATVPQSPEEPGTEAPKTAGRQSKADPDEEVTLF
jgi:exodeoxyribonuclease VII small subunit